MGHIDPDEDLKAALERLKVAKEQVEREREAADKELAAIMMESESAETHRYPRSQTKRRRRMNPYMLPPVVPSVLDSSESLAVNGYLLGSKVIQPMLERIKRGSIKVSIETPEEGVKTILISGTVEDHSGGKQSIEIFKLDGEDETKYEFSIRKIPQEKEDHSGDEATTVDEAG